MNEIRGRTFSISEESILDALILDPLGAANILTGFCKSPQSSFGPGAVSDIGRETDIHGERLSKIIDSLDRKSVV